MVSDYKIRHLASKWKLSVLATFFLLLSPTGCTVSYTASGARILPQIKTASIQYFLNRASLVQPGLSQTLTEALIDKCKAQTSLSIVSSNGDVTFEGEITDYNTRPLTVSADATAAMNRFTITVKVKFTNNKDHEQDWEKTFTQYEDFDSNRSLTDVEDALASAIIKKLVDDIFNASVADW